MPPERAADPVPLRVLIAGAGVAGLEAALALHALAGERVALTLLDRADAFVHRPMTVAEPFSGEQARHYPLAALTERARTYHVRDGLAAVRPSEHAVLTTGGRRLTYDVLLIAVGVQAVPAFDRGLTFDPAQAQAVGWLLRDLAAGDAKRVAVIVPPGPHWTVPAYELALLIAGHARDAGHDDVVVTVVVPEPAPLADFGATVSAAVRAELERAGVELETGCRAQVRAGHGTTVLLAPGPRTLEVDRLIALPRLEPRAVLGLGTDARSFIRVDEHGRVAGVADVYAAGDATDHPIKQGGLAAQQADAAAAHIAARAGAAVDPAPFRPVLRGRLITGAGDRWLRRGPPPAAAGRIARHTLWWPPDKLAARYLAPALAEYDGVSPAVLAAPPAGEEIELLLGDG
jgi:sulfide:quinone oxidoreductase